MDLKRQYNILMMNQATLNQGIQDLQEIRRQAVQDLSSAEAWASIGLIANATLIPLNCIINFFQVGKARSVYQQVVTLSYKKLASSGTRADGGVAMLLKEFKKAIVEDLTNRGLKNAIPGVNILVGLAEDTNATFQSLERLEEGQKEGRALLRQIDSQIGKMIRELEQIGINRAILLEKVEMVGRTA